MLYRLVIAFLSRSKRLLISWLQSPSAVILESPKIKSLTASTVSPSICHEVMGLDAMILVFWMLSFKPTISFSSFTFIKRLFSPSSLSAIREVSSVYLRLLIFLLAILIPAHRTWVLKKTKALTRWTFVNKVMSLLFNMLSRFVIAFLSRSRYLLISWLQSPPTVIFGPKKIKSAAVSTLSQSVATKWWEQMPWS